MKLSAPIYQLKRRAKLLARDEKIPLHTALDRLAHEEGFAAWSLLASRFGMKVPSLQMLPWLSEGDLLLLAARPRHGKTLLGLRLLLDAVRDGRKAVFFTLEYSRCEAEERVRSLDDQIPGLDEMLEIVTSDDICADYIIRHLAGSPRGTVAVIDYLQILDQRRSKPELSRQMSVLQDFARKRGVVLGFISQIDRSFDPASKPLPDMADIRLPNRIDPGVFSKACFLHHGKIRLQAMI